MTRRLPLLAALLALGACNAHTPTASTGASRYVSLDAALESDPAMGPSGLRAPERRASPVAVLPAWIGRATDLRERDEAAFFEQAITLGSAPRGDAGHNLLLVGVRRSGDAPARGADVPADLVGKPTQAGIRAEIEAAFPGIAMRVVTRPAANAYGPYGLAIGRDAAGVRCLYAWQWIEEPPALDRGQSAAAPMALRIRLCRADTTLEAMAAAVNQLRIVPRFEGRPVMTPPATVAKSPAASGRHRVEPRRRTGQAQVAVARMGLEANRDFAPSDAGSVAPPTSDPSGRRYLGAEAPSAPALGALPGTLAGLGGAPVAVSSGISADLPPEATRGPAGPSSR